jgi:hypothetical protein
MPRIIHAGDGSILRLRLRLRGPPPSDTAPSPQNGIGLQADVRCAAEVKTPRATDLTNRFHPSQTSTNALRQAAISTSSCRAVL